MNWHWHCGVTASFGAFFHEIERNRMTSFMELMCWQCPYPISLLVCPEEVRIRKRQWFCHVLQIAVVEVSILNWGPQNGGWETAAKWSHLMDVTWKTNWQLAVNDTYDNNFFCKLVTVVSGMILIWFFASCWQSALSDMTMICFFASCWQSAVSDMTICFLASYWQLALREMKHFVAWQVVDSQL